MTTDSVQKVNGIDRELLSGYGAAMDSARSGLVQAQLRHVWRGAFEVEGVSDRLDAGGEASSRQHHAFHTDWPQPFSRDAGPTPGLELLLAAAAACAITTCAAKAATLSIAIEQMEAFTTGAVDMRGLFEIGDGVPVGLTRIDIELRVRSPASDADLAELERTVRRTSPTLNTLSSGANPRLTLRRMEVTR